MVHKDTEHLKRQFHTGTDEIDATLLIPDIYCPEGAFCVGTLKIFDVRAFVGPSVRPLVS